MRILICLKQVPDTTEVRLTDDLTLEREFVAQVLNPADESALELGLKLKEKQGGTVTVLTMGPRRAEGMLREALSRGADEAVLMTSPRFAGADTLVTVGGVQTNHGRLTAAAAAKAGLACTLVLDGARPEKLSGNLLLDCLLTQAQQHPDFQQLEGSWVLEDNTAIDDLIEDFSGRITKRYRLYRREITA